MRGNRAYLNSNSTKSDVFRVLKTTSNCFLTQSLELYPRKLISHKYTDTVARGQKVFMSMLAAELEIEENDWLVPMGLPQPACHTVVVN